MTRDTVTNTVNAHGNVLYQEKGYALSSDTGFLDTDTSRGVFRNTQFILSTIPARGTSRLTHLDSATLSRYQKFTYTACPPGNTDWLLHASHVKLNKETGVGTARNAWLEFHDVPLLWAPYFRFPIDDRRQTGFLTPSLAATKVGGVDLQVPYYFNLAPNYDWTVTPRYLTRRGFLLRNEFRYLTEMTRGQLLADIMPHDEQTKTTRGQLGFLNNTRFSENLIAHVDANYVSDNRYLYQLGSALSLVNWANIPSQAYLRYTGSNYLFQTTANYYQTIDPLIPPQAKPYFNLPQFLFAYNHALLDTGVLFDGQVQLDNFETTGTQKTTGQRLKLRPRLYYPFQVAGGFITPSVSLLHNQYWLQNPEYWGQATQTATRAQEQFTVPILSLDSGAYFDRDFQWGETPCCKPWSPACSISISHGQNKTTFLYLILPSMISLITNYFARTGSPAATGWGCQPAEFGHDDPPDRPGQRARAASGQPWQRALFSGSSGDPNRAAFAQPTPEHLQPHFGNLCQSDR